MLSRLYLDNFRCFANFEYRPARKQLIVGRNGSGKSSLLEALFLVRQFAVSGNKAEDFPVLSQRTRWLNQAQQTFEIESFLDGGQYVYRLLLDQWGEPPLPRVVSETVHLDGKPIFEFTSGEVHLYNDRFEQKVTYPFDWHRSALATMQSRKDNLKLTRFRVWFGGLLCFRINPFAIGARADREDLYPFLDLRNFAGWYRHLVQANPKQNAALLDSLRAAIDGFSYLGLDPFGENVRLLFAEFSQTNGTNLKLFFNELSDGQRCLVALYAILHFLLARGNTVILDEPENFVSLPEIQPWLMRVADVVEDGAGQVLLISHHPELINQWAPNCGVQFVRDGIGPVRVEQFHGDAKSSLPPSELIARGWERG